MSGLIAVVAALVVYRLTMLVVADEVTEPLRDRNAVRYVHPVHEVTDWPDGKRAIEAGSGEYYTSCRCGLSWSGPDWSDVVSELNGHLNDEHRAGIEMTKGPRWLILLSCPWCSSWWIGLPVVWSAWCFGDRSWWIVPAGALAASAVTGIIATFAKPES